jgi:hypothetical protein
VALMRLIERAGHQVRAVAAITHRYVKVKIAFDLGAFAGP